MQDAACLLNEQQCDFSFIITGKHNPLICWINVISNHFTMHLNSNTYLNVQINGRRVYNVAYLLIISQVTPFPSHEFLNMQFSNYPIALSNLFH